MITKSIVKDYASRKCAYLAKAELDDNSLLKLIENYLSIGKVEDLETPSGDFEADGLAENPDEEKTFDVIELMKDNPNLRKQIQELVDENERKNPLFKLLQKYDDSQVCADLSRRYIELIYGEKVCKRCDINDFGVNAMNQSFIVNRTKECLLDPNIKVIFEGQVEFGDLRARFDALIKEDDGSYTLIEAKGSNSPFKLKKDHPEIQTGIKQNYLFDLAFQYYVYVKAGLNISKLGFLHLNRDFKLSEHALNYPKLSDEDIKNLFQISYEMNYQKGRKDPIPVSIIKYIDGDMYVDFDEDGNPKSDTVEDIIYKLETINKAPATLATKHYECVKAGKCPFILPCFPDAEDSNSTFKLSRWNLYGGNWTKSKKIIDAGIEHITEIPTNVVNEFKEEAIDKESGMLKGYYNIKSQIKFETDWKNKDFDYVIRMKLLKEILNADYDNDGIDYLVFFDFESIQNPVPLMKDAHPWQQIVTQYSMHIVKKGYDLTKHDFDKGRGGGCSHYEFIGHPKKDGYTNPEFELFKTLKAQLEDFGIDPMAKNYRVVVFNQNFEKTRMNEFVRLYTSHKDVTPELIDFVNNFNDNVVDLLFVFTRGALYGRDFKGRGSLKVVQPTLCADEDVLNYYHSIGLPFNFEYSLDYHKGDKCLVYNGGICLDLFKALLVRSHQNIDDNDPDEDKMLAEALAYCKIDSWGTVIIYDILKHICDGKIKLKALYL